MKKSALLCLFAIAGCGGGAASPGPATYAEFLQQKSELSCNAIFNCCNADRIAETSNAYTDVPSCVAYTVAQNGYNSDALALTYGPPVGYVYDAAQAAKCLATLKTAYADCDKTAFFYSTEPLECILATRGSQAIGSVCDPDASTVAGLVCIPGALCAPDTAFNGGDAPQPGHCVAVAKIGEACDDSHPCEFGTGAFCNSDGESVCTRPLGKGANCSEDYECAYPFVCNFVGDTGTCGDFVPYPDDDPNVTDESALCYYDES